MVVRPLSNLGSGSFRLIAFDDEGPDLKPVLPGFKFPPENPGQCRDILDPHGRIMTAVSIILPTAVPPGEPDDPGPTKTEEVVQGIARPPGRIGNPATGRRPELEDCHRFGCRQSPEARVPPIHLCAKTLCPSIQRSLGTIHADANPVDKLIPRIVILKPVPRLAG